MLSIATELTPCSISPTAALEVFTEVGSDLSSFPNEHHFVSWLRFSPRMNFSAGKPLNKRRNGTGANRIAHVLRLAAVSVGRTQTSIGAYYRRVARRKGAKVAIFATARKIATLLYRMLRYGQDYVDEGAKAYDQRFEQRRLISITASALDLGFQLVPINLPTEGVSG